MMNYGGYRVNAGKHFPTYYATFEQATAAAWFFTNHTGKEARVYGLLDNGCHLLKVTRKNPPRT